MTAVIAERIASIKQISFIARLIGEREWDQGNPRAVAAAGYLAGRTGISSGEACMTITYLLGCPRKEATQAKPGYYLSGDTVVCVMWNQDRTHTYAKALVIENGRARWGYTPGIAARLAAAGTHPLTVAEASALGHLHGICVVCAKGLTDPASVKRGIGPVCAKRLTSASPTTQAMDTTDADNAAEVALARQDAAEAAAR